VQTASCKLIATPYTSAIHFPFSNVGTNDAAPLTIKVNRQKSTKANVALFVYMSRKAGYKRINRCSHRFCVSVWTLSAHVFEQWDQLHRCYELLNDRSHKKLVCYTVTSKQTHFYFNPHSAPHFGSLDLTR
jgi:hypothetical protein